MRVKRGRLRGCRGCGGEDRTRGSRIYWQLRGGREEGAQKEVGQELRGGGTEVKI